MESSATAANVPPPPPENDAYTLSKDLSAAFSPQALSEITEGFQQFDVFQDGRILKTQLPKVLGQLGIEFDEISIQMASEDSSSMHGRMLRKIHSFTRKAMDKAGVSGEGEDVTFPQFVRLVLELQKKSSSPSVSPEKMRTIAKRNSLTDSQDQGKAVTQVRVEGRTGVSSYSQEEKFAFSEHINQTLQHDEDLRSRLPMDPASDGLFEVCNDGIIFCKIINLIEPDTVDERCLNLAKPDKPLSIYHMVENLNLAIGAAQAVGVQVVNVGAHDIMQGNPILILGLVWQLIKLQLLNTISLKEHPELVRLLGEGEDLSALLSLTPDKILMRWVNFHLKAAHSQRCIQDFGPSLQDCEVYSILLNRLSPELCPLITATDPAERAKAVINNAQTMNVATFLQPSDIVNGNSKLNMAFVAQVFNQCPGLDMPTGDEATQLGVTVTDFATMDETEDVEDTKEERTFRHWINSLNMDGVYVTNLYSGVSDAGAFLMLQLIDHIAPGTVEWKRVNKNPKNRFKQIENANYALKVGQEFGIHIVNIGPYDLLDGNKKLILGIMWQLMRRHTLIILAKLANTVESVSDDAIVNWANSKVASVGRASSMSSFKDRTLSSGVFLIDLCFSLAPNTVDWDIVKAGQTDEEKLNNCKYAISIARKYGAHVFLTAEDIIEVRPKLLMTFVASLWVKSLENEAASENDETDETKLS